MTTIYLATSDGIVALRRRLDHWHANVFMQGQDCRCVAVDPCLRQHVFCGTYGTGLWHSEDAGHFWEPAGEGIGSEKVLSVAVSAKERAGKYGVVWAGTEPSAIYRSEDGGLTWRERPTLRELPSAPSRVRSIAPDPHVAERLVAGIEKGGVMRSLDAGLTWEDHNPAAQDDPHTLAMHVMAQGRIYEAAGGGYAESYDGGASWMRYDVGMEDHYLFGMAIDPADPDTVVVSASPAWYRAHTPLIAKSTVYRKVAQEAWKEVTAGLPMRLTQRIYCLAANDAEPHVFYLATHGGELYRSEDAGENWQKLKIRWPVNYDVQEVHALAVAEVV